MRSTTYIYGLTDPFTGSVRYVGKSNDPNKRLNGHMNEAARHYTPTHKNNWVLSILNRGSRPLVFIIDEVSNLQWPFWETHYHDLYRSWGFDLVNVRGYLGTGQDGSRETTAVLEARKKFAQYWKGKSQSEEHKKKKGIKSKEFARTDKGKELHSALGKQNIGRHHSEDIKNERSEKMKKFFADNPDIKPGPKIGNFRQTEETKEKIRQSKLGKKKINGKYIKI